MTIQELKVMPKEEFLKLPDATEELYDIIKNAKSGIIYIKHRTHREEHSGYTPAFAAGISMRIDGADSWYTTSIVQEINWEEGWFRTMNSIYDFKFKEDENKNN